jgi:hypothetical protein
MYRQAEHTRTGRPAEDAAYRPDEDAAYRPAEDREASRGNRRQPAGDRKRVALKGID